MSRQEALTYLENHNVVTLATVGDKGVWAAAVYYVNDHTTLYFLSAPHTRHGRNIAANPRVAATIQEDYSDWESIKGIQLEGVCTLISGEERDGAVSRYATKFPVVGPDAPPQIANALDKIGWYKIVPKRLYFIDNSKGLGHRVEIVDDLHSTAND